MKAKAGAKPGPGSEETKREKQATIPVVHPARMVDLSSLKDHPANYRKHPDDQVQHLISSLGEHGVYKNVVVARDGTILAGHGVVAAARRAGLKKVPAVRLDVGPSDRRAVKLMIADNELSRIVEDDDRALTELLKQVRGDDPEQLLGTGYDDERLAGLLALVADPVSPIAFRSVDESIHTEYQCPKCSYRWSGKPS